MKSLVYLAMPYSIGNHEVNVCQSILVSDRLLELGCIPFNPLLFHFWDVISPKPKEVWMEIDKAILRRCDILLRMGGESEGADEEVELAKELGIRVCYSIEELKAI